MIEKRKYFSLNHLFSFIATQANVEDFAVAKASCSIENQVDC